MTYEKLETHLRNLNVEYDLIRHEKSIRSAKEGADYFGIDIGQTVPTIILSVDNKLQAIIMSGKREKIDFNKLKNILNANAIEMASKEDILNQTGYSIGNIPMVNLTIPCIIDGELLTYDYVYGGSGIKNITLKISPLSLLKVNSTFRIIDNL